MQITRRSQQRFADLCAAHGTIRTIEAVYEAHGFDLPASFEPAQVGARRSVCAAAEHGADLSDGQVQQRLLRVYLDGIDDFGRRPTDISSRRHRSPRTHSCPRRVHSCARSSAMGRR